MLGTTYCSERKYARLRTPESRDPSNFELSNSLINKIIYTFVAFNQLYKKQAPVVLCRCWWKHTCDQKVIVVEIFCSVQFNNYIYIIDSCLPFYILQTKMQRLHILVLDEVFFCIKGTHGWIANRPLSNHVFILYFQFPENFMESIFFGNLNHKWFQTFYMRIAYS